MAQEAGRQPAQPPRDGNRPPQKPPSFTSQLRSPRFWVTLLVLLAINYFVTNYLLSTNQPQRVDISYTTFKSQIEAGNVASITSTGRDIQGTTKTAVSASSDAKQKSTRFHTVVPEFAGSDLEPLLEKHNVQVNAANDTGAMPVWLQLLLYFGPTLGLIAFFIWASRRAAGAGGGLLGSFGRSSARL
jgi:cell division protease FtsH